MLKRYIVVHAFQHGAGSYREGSQVDFHESVGDQLMRRGLLLDYVAPTLDPQPPVRESSASRPGRASRKQTSR